jgi:hypothetical protein
VARRSVVLLQIAVVYFVILRIVYGVFVPPNGDEAYYWLWGGHLQLSYYDHAPMVGWTSAVGRALLGWTPAGLHLPAFVTFLVLTLALFRASRWLAPADPDWFFWLGLALFCASPLFNALTTLNYPDHLMICFAALALLWMGRFLNGAMEGSENPADLYVGALFLGLAGLSKYNAVFIPAGLVVVMVAAPRLRRLFGSPHLYAAGALTFVITLPVYIWNAENRFASVELHAVERLEEATSAFTPLLLLRVIVLSALMLSPFVIWAFVKYLFSRAAEPRQAGLILLGRGTALISTLLLLPLAAWGALGDQVSPHWLVLSFLPFMLVAPFYVRSRWLIGLHLGWGALINTTAVLYYVLAPLPTEFFGIRDYEAARTFGQEQLAEAVAGLAAEHGVIAIYGHGYPLLARLAFALGDDAAVTDLGQRVDRLTGRTFGPESAGKDMLLVGNAVGLADRFDSLEQLPSIEVERFGRPIATYEIRIGHGFKP